MYQTPLEVKLVTPTKDKHTLMSLAVGRYWVRVALFPAGMLTVLTANWAGGWALFSAGMLTILTANWAGD